MQAICEDELLVRAAGMRQTLAPPARAYGGLRSVGRGPLCCALLRSSPRSCAPNAMSPTSKPLDSVTGEPIEFVGHSEVKSSASLPMSIASADLTLQVITAASRSSFGYVAVSRLNLSTHMIQYRSDFCSEG